jgi:hypothetical protein
MAAKYLLSKENDASVRAMIMADRDRHLAMQQ